MKKAKVFGKFGIIILSLGCLAIVSTNLLLLQAQSFSAGSSKASKKYGQDNLSNFEKIERMATEYQREFPEVPEITASMLKRKLDDSKVVLVDVRSEKELKVSMIPGSVTRKYFEAHLAKYKSSTIVPYCTIGLRSGKYAKELLSKGIKAYNLRGGILSWVNSGGKLSTPDSRPTNKVHVYGRKWNLVPDGIESVW